MINIDIFHNILWSKYKGGVFSALSRLSNKDINFNFIQIAATENSRVGLAAVDMSYHTYPHKLLFDQTYESIPRKALFKSLIRSIFASNADMVILPGYHRIEYWLMLFACILRGTPRGVFCDSTGADRKSSALKGFAKKLFFSRCNAFFVYGERSKEYIMSFGVASAKIFHKCQAAALPPGYDPSEAVSSRSRYISYEAEARILYVGRISAEKGLHCLLDAFTSIQKEKASAKLVLIGSGPLRAELESRVKALGIADAVEFKGSMQIDAICKEYAESSCLVLPSSSEPWGLVVNESLSYGCPVVVSNACGCVPELVSGHGTGEVFPVGDSAALAGCLLKVINLSVDERRHMSLLAIELMKRYTPECAAQKIQDGCSTTLKKLGLL